ncbi:hypothetical protein LDC_0619, partial [sediment metagenome]
YVSKHSLFFYFSSITQTPSQLFSGAFIENCKHLLTKIELGISHRSTKSEKIFDAFSKSFSKYNFKAFSNLEMISSL